MLKPELPDTEIHRLTALRDLHVLDTPAESRFDQITALVSLTFNCQIVLVSLVDADRQWFKSRQGLDACQTSRDISFCGHAILQDGLFEICDAAADPRFADNPLLAGDIPRLIITPHCAWGSREARQRIVGQLAENAHAYFNAAPRRLIN